jgi:hypothetical protein
MKMNLLPLVLLLASAAPARADVPLLAPVQIDVTGFKAKLHDGRVVMTWRRYKRDDFVSYAIVKSSEKETDPGYPGTASVATFGAPEGVKCEDGKLSVGTWNYRLVITTRFGDRWVSPVVNVVVNAGDIRHTPPVNSDFAD